MADDNSAEARFEARRREAERLRVAARSTTPNAYKQTERPAIPDTDVVDTSVNAGESYSSLFGSFTGSRSIREHISTAMMLGAQGLAYIGLVAVLSLAQCSWWYERGMYSDPDRIESVGR